MGKMPLSECRRRQRKELPWPARSAATPAATLGTLASAGELTDVATVQLLIKSMKM